MTLLQSEDWLVLNPGCELGSGLLYVYYYYFFSWGLRLMRQYLPRVCSSHSCPRNVGGQDKLEAYVKPLFVSYLLLSPWPRQVIWSNPMSMGQGSKLHPQRKVKGSEYLLNRPNSQRIKNLHFLTQAIKANCRIVILKILLKGTGIERPWLAVRSF